MMCGGSSDFEACTVCMCMFITINERFVWMTNCLKTKQVSLSVSCKRRKIDDIV